jgi:hypothetical protein
MAQITMVPISITAKTEKELTINMLKNNTIFSCQFIYFDIQFVKNKWVAWYFNDLINEASKSKLKDF